MLRPRKKKLDIMLHSILFSIIFMCLFVNGQSEGTTPSCAEKEKSLAALDLAKDAISKAKNLYPNCNDDPTTLNKSVCGKKEKSLGYIEVALGLISEAKDNFPTCPPSNEQKLHSKPMDCTDVLENGQNKSGVYTIWPRSRITGHGPLQVFCDMDTDGGGWTVIQRRDNFSKQEDFYRDWEDYKNGFGNINRDFWIGNDNIFSLSNQGLYSIRFDMKDVDRNSSFSLYQAFWIDDEKSNYTLHISNYSGKAGDSMEFHNNQIFSTKDRDNKSCAKAKKGAWWYNGCSRCNPNGQYKPGAINPDPDYIYWKSWKEWLGLAAIEIKLRRV